VTLPAPGSRLAVPGTRHWLALLLVNAALATLMRAGAPTQPVNSDRVEYEYAGRNLLAPGCPHDVYCYRILVPWVLEQVPADPEWRWRTLAQVANTAAGFIVALNTASLTPAWQAPLLASLIVQMSFGFTMTAYDPYSPDPVVFLVAAAISWLWFRDRPLVALAIAAVSVFGKETVAVIAAAAACGAVAARRPSWRAWAAQTIVPLVLVLGFHWVMETYVGWSVERNQAAKFLEGSWIAVWLANMDSPRRIALLLFIPFGFAWLYAWAGYRWAPRPLRSLALGTLLPVLALNYVQNPERALGNAFFVIAPLAAILLSRVPVPLAFFAAIANGLLTTKVGLSTAWLPSSSLLIIPAAVSAIWALWRGWLSKGALEGSSRIENSGR
jgi:hypothetical protein